MNTAKYKLRKKYICKELIDQSYEKEGIITEIILR